MSRIQFSRVEIEFRAGSGYESTESNSTNSSEALMTALSEIVGILATDGQGAEAMLTAEIARTKAEQRAGIAKKVPA